MSYELAVQDIGETFGALFIGVIIAALIFGVTNVQTFIYFQANRGTGTTLYKLAVIWLWIIDALHLALITHVVYHYLVINYGNDSALADIVWSFKLQAVTSALIIYPVDILYVHRIWIFSKGRSRILPVTVATLVSVLGLAVTIVLIWSAYRSQTFIGWIRLHWAIYMTLGAITLNDLVITSSLCYLLATSRTGFSSTDSFLTKLMAYTIQSGFLTSVTSMTAIITCAVMPDNFINTAIQFIVVKIYVTSFLALMNTRYYLQSKHSDTVNIPRMDVYRPSLHTGGSEAERSEESRKNVFQHPDGHDDELYPARHVQAVMVDRRITVD